MLLKSLEGARCSGFMEKDWADDVSAVKIYRERMRKILIWSGLSQYLKYTNWPKY